MLIYRVEHKETGIGPYSADDYTIKDMRICDMGWAHTNDMHPGMWKDCDPELINYGSGHDYYCAFSSMDDLHAWFDGYMEILHNNEFHIVTYTVHEYDVIKGTYQVVFLKQFATQESTQPCQ